MSCLSGVLVTLLYHVMLS